MEQSITSWLFETDAVRVCQEGQPFWYTSGKIGPFYINTHFLFGSENESNALLTLIEEAAADKITFAARVGAALEEQYQRNAIYRGLIDQLTQAAQAIPCDVLSGGERRDFFFSLPVARRLGKPHICIFKDLSCTLAGPEGQDARVAEASFLAGQNALHIADLVTEASSYLRAWLPALKTLGVVMNRTLVVVDRDQGGFEALAASGVALTALVKIDPAFFQQAVSLGLLSGEQAAMALAFLQDPAAFMRDFLAAHPSFLQEQIALGGKAQERAQRCMAMGFDKA